MSRRQARETALQALFQLDLNHGSEDEAELYETLAVDTAIGECDKISVSEREYVLSTVHGTRIHLEEIDEQISKHAKGWKLSRMGAVDRNIMRLATYEMRFGDLQTEPKIAVNEAVELAKKYGTDDSSRFVNGILNAMMK
jgi:N utilization substance protein B